MEGNDSDLVKHFQNKNWLSKLFYLSDTLDKLNDLNISLQSKNRNVLTLTSKIKAFLKKINAWLMNVKSNSYEMFHVWILEEFITENKLNFEIIKPIIIKHLENVFFQNQT